MKPIRANETNFTYMGPTPDITDLPCRKEGSDTFSIWELTPEDRTQIASGANIRLGIYGMQPIPPVSLQVVAAVGPFAREGTEPIEIHINTRDENGVKQPLDEKTAVACGRAAKAIHKHYSEKLRANPPGPPSPPRPPGPRAVG